MVWRIDRIALAAIAAAGAFSALAVPATIKTSADVMSGDVKWLAGSKKYALTKGAITREYAPSDIVKLDVAKPQTLDRAIQMVKRGQAGSAIPILTNLVKDYRMLTWDKVACRYLTEAYIKTGNPQKAYDAANIVINDDKSAAWKGELAPAFWQALLKLGKKNALEACLDKAATSGGRAASAHALVMRGDMMLDAEGNTRDVNRRALKDAYLKVALMYQDPECAAARLEALEKGAKCFDEIGMRARAEAFRKKAASLAKQ